MVTLIVLEIQMIIVWISHFVYLHGFPIEFLELMLYKQPETGQNMGPYVKEALDHVSFKFVGDNHEGTLYKI